MKLAARPNIHFVRRRSTIVLLLAMAVCALVTPAHASDLSRRLQDVMRVHSATHCICLVTVTDVATVKRDETRSDLVATLKIVESLVGNTNDRIVKFFDPAFCTVIETGPPRAFGHLPFARSPKPKIGDKWIFSYFPDPSKDTYSIGDRSFGAELADDESVKFVRTLGNRIRNLDTKDAVQMYVSEFSDKTKTDSQRICCAIAALSVIKTTTHDLVGSPFAPMARGMAISALSDPKSTLAFKSEMARMLVVHSENANLTKEECESIRFMNTYSKTCDDSQLRHTLVTNLAYAAVGSRMSGEVWVYPEIVDMLESIGNDEDPNGPQHTRSRWVLVKDEIKGYNDDETQKKRLRLKYLPY